MANFTTSLIAENGQCIKMGVAKFNLVGVNCALGKYSDNRSREIQVHRRRDAITRTITEEQRRNMIDWDYPNPYTAEITVQAKDIDGMGHANNACYVVWCEQTAWLHSESLGLSVLDYQKLDRGVAINKASYDYYLPSFVNQQLLAATWLTACDGKLRLERRFQFINPESGETVLRGHWRLICVTLSNGKASRFPKEFIDIYGGAIV